MVRLHFPDREVGIILLLSIRLYCHGDKSTIARRPRYHDDGVFLSPHPLPPPKKNSVFKI